MPKPLASTAPDRVLHAISKIFIVVGALGITTLMLLTVVGVFWRYILRDPIFGINDLSSLTLIIVAACAVAFGATTQAHVSVNLISMVFGRNVTRITDCIMRVIAIYITGLAVYALWKKACGFEKACITANLSIEHTPFYYVLALGMAFYMLVFVVHLGVGLVNFSGDDPNEPAD